MLMHSGIYRIDPSILDRPCRLDAMKVVGRGCRPTTSEQAGRHGGCWPGLQAYDLRAGWTPWWSLAGAAGLSTKGGLDIMVLTGCGCRTKT